MTAELTSDEFLRLQEELLNLKMQTEELRQENARLLRHVQEPLMGNMEALRKAGAGAVSGAVGAVSAIGQRAGASLKSSLDGSTFQGHFQEGHGHGREVVDAEVSALHERLKEVTEELNAARQDAMLAQREATAAEGHTPNGSGPPVQDVLTVSQALLLKVQQQQRDLERVREAVDGQQAQVQRLTEKAASERMTKPAAVALPGLEEQLRSAEGKLDELGRRLQSSQGTSRLTYELRCHMESVLDRVRIKSSADFVWDVYALSDTPAPNLAASLRLQDPLELDLEDGLDDLEDIDDSSDEGRPCGPDSDSDDWHETQDHSNWTDVLD